MKKILLSAAAIMAFGFANAQDTPTKGFTKGDVFASGSIGYGSEKTGENKNNVFTFSPKAGYFVTNNIAVGVKLGFTSGKDTEQVGPASIETKTNTFEAGAFGRYYFTPASQFSFFGELSAGFNSSKTEIEGVPGESKSNGFNVGVAPGISYFVSNNIALEATFGLLGYKTNKPDVDGAESTDTFNIGANFSDIRFGIVYKF